MQDKLHAIIFRLNELTGHLSNANSIYANSSGEIAEMVMDLLEQPGTCESGKCEVKKTSKK